MAEHRGLKLIRSRKRTPGVGDYGKFGLTDVAGKAILGVSECGLTASAKEIEAYLRASTRDTWKRSGETIPAAKPRKRQPHRTDPVDDESPIRRRPTIGSRDRSSAPTRQKHDLPRKADGIPAVMPVLKIVSKDPTPQPQLKLRAALKTDAAILAHLLEQLADQKINRSEVARNLESVREAKGQVLVAERSGVIGCCVWVAVPTLQRGKVGRITLLLVDKEHRRTGIASALLAAVEERLATAGCSEVEVMSDIMINNAHNFFRALKFQQKSYRFVRRVSASVAPPARTD